MSVSRLDRTTSLDPPPEKTIFRIGSVDERPIPSAATSTYASSEPGDLSQPSVLFPSMRLMLAAMLCCCFITLSISSSNLAVALICMTSCPHHGYGGDLKWKSEQVFIALLLCCVGNIVLPLFAAQSFWFAVAARIAVGASDACLMPACNSLITRWFPQSERAAAIGLISGGRQIGNYP
uniref:MFS domain-containing protein n=1 Tax=Heterorhabditis bacteriophora TaxID=37862 RepID=A0A1I7X9W8_HETBA